jgi:hypothetical protein
LVEGVRRSGHERFNQRLSHQVITGRRLDDRPEALAANDI